MREFFKSWRRRLGVATLLMACLCTALWVRSGSIKDKFTTSFTHYSSHELISACGGLMVHRYSHTVKSDDPLMKPTWESEEIGEIEFDYPDRQLKNHVFLADCGAKTDWHHAHAWIQIPYSTLDIPLMALSAFLLLRPNQRRKPNQSVARNGTKDLALDNRPRPNDRSQSTDQHQIHQVLKAVPQTDTANDSWVKFFKPWRRRIGGVSLALACGFMLLWVRGISCVDVVTYDGEFTEISLTCSRRGITFESETRPPKYPTEARGWAVDQFDESGWYEPHFLEIEHAGYQLMGLQFYWTRTTDESIGGTIAQIPHWAIVVPLTLLSAWLLLWQPRPNPRRPVTHA